MRAIHLLPLTIAALYSLTAPAQVDSTAIKVTDKSSVAHSLRYYNSNGWKSFYAVAQERTDSTQTDHDRTTAQQAVNETLPDIEIFLARHKWSLIQLNGHSADMYRAFLSFEGKNGKVSGSTGCNNFWGTFQIADNTIRFAPLAATMKACTGKNIEKEVFSVLEHKDLRFDIAEHTLNFYIRNKLVMIFGADRK